MRTLSASGLLLALTGCAAAPTPSHGEVAELRQRLDEQARRAAAAEHKLDELENRVFLLTDQLESAKVASLRRSTRALPSLPVVTLKPQATTAAAGEGEVDDAGEQIEFAGAARSSEPERVRPSLRLDGDARPVAHHPSGREAEVELPAAATADNLGVAAAPPIHGGTPLAAASSSFAGASGSVAEHAAAERSAPAGEPLALYRAAYDDLRAGRHDEAARQFRDFIKRYPRHDYADNAQYWLGEVYYDQKRYDEAAPEFRAVLTRWPGGNKAPDAMLKLGFTLAAAGKLTEARAILRELPTTYPHTEAARLAASRLTQLPSTEGTK